MGWFGPNTWGDDARAYDRARKRAAAVKKQRARQARKRAKGNGKPRRQVFGPFYWQ